MTDVPEVDLPNIDWQPHQRKLLEAMMTESKRAVVVLSFRQMGHHAALENTRRTIEAMWHSLSEARSGS